MVPPTSHHLPFLCEGHLQRGLGAGLGRLVLLCYWGPIFRLMGTGPPCSGCLCRRERSLGRWDPPPQPPACLVGLALPPPFFWTWVFVLIFPLRLWWGWEAALTTRAWVTVKGLEGRSEVGGAWPRPSRDILVLPREEAAPWAPSAERSSPIAWLVWKCVHTQWRSVHIAPCAHSHVP